MKGIILSDTDAAYIAGLLDGEGCFNIGKHYNKTKHCSEIRLAISTLNNPSRVLMGGAKVRQQKLEAQN